VPKARLLALTTVALLAAGCSGSPSSPVPSSASSSSAAAPPSAAPTVTTSPGTPAAPPCPDGDYVVSAFEGRGQASAAGRGSGGNVAADFRSGTFTISSDGSQPVSLDLGPVNAELRFDGDITGTYEGEPSALRLTATGAHGDAVVKGFGVRRSYAMSGLADQLVGSGATAQVTCDGAAGTAVVVLPDASLTLTRRG
jgi:hypothetical protein